MTKGLLFIYALIVLGTASIDAADEQTVSEFSVSKFCDNALKEYTVKQGKMFAKAESERLPEIDPKKLEVMAYQMNAETLTTIMVDHCSHDVRRQKKFKALINANKVACFEAYQDLPPDHWPFSQPTQRKLF